jgi:polyvinyl alcohol dehydrogenase (cytochrome)
MLIEQHRSSICSALIILTIVLNAMTAAAGAWTSWSGDHWNTRFAWRERILNRFNVPSLELKWSVQLSGRTEVNPTVVGNDLYTTDRGGWLYRIDIRSGKILWQRNVEEYNGMPGSYSRSSPAIAGSVLYIGDSPARGAADKRTHVMAINRFSGQLFWISSIGDHPTASITQSPLVVGSRVYVGISSSESFEEATEPGYDCCSFRGSMVALNRFTGSVVWKTFMIADGFASPEEYSGASVWGRNPAVDLQRQLIYVPTGQNYDVPDRMRECERLRRLSPTPELEPSCVEEDINLANSITALDLDTGAVVWNQHLEGYDAWNVTCGFFEGLDTLNSQNCPDPKGPDFDFGQGPILMSFSETPGRWKPRRQVLLAGQKSGVAYGLDPDAGGEVLWATQVGPGGRLGGMEFGSAVDFSRYYVSIANLEHTPYQLPDGRTVNGGSVAALDPLTGEILWQTPDPASFLPVQGNIPITENLRIGFGFLGVITAPLTTIQGVVFAASNDILGHLYALDGRTGRILFRFAGGLPSNNGATIVDGRVYWATGSNIVPLPIPSTLYAFGLPGD